MQDRIKRLRALNALADALVDLKASIFEIEGVKLKYKERRMTTDGGPGSGNFNHTGRLGQVGGSAGEGSGGDESDSSSKGQSKGAESRVAKSLKPRYSPSKRPKEVRLPKAEYAMVMEELNTNLTEEELKRDFISRPILNHVYTIKVNEYGDYKVIKKRKIQSRGWSEKSKQKETGDE